MLSSDQLTMIQGLAALLFLICLGGGAIYLIAGLIRPAWVRRTKRRWVATTTVVVWSLGLVTYIGAIVFTHSHPNGPHAFKGYWERYVAEMCAEGRDIPACRERASGSGDADAAPAESPSH